MGESLHSKFRKLNGFILLEVLVALTVIGIAVGLFWNSKLANVRFHARITEKLVSERLVHDAKILLDIKKPELFEVKGYRGLENLNWLQNGVVFNYYGQSKREILF